MTIKISITTTEPHIPKDYRRTFLHLIKTVIQQEDPLLFNQYYEGTKRKPFTFWANLHKAKFMDKSICLENGQLTLFFSTDNTKLSFVLYNGFKKLLHTPLSIGETNKAIVESVRVISDKEIRDETIIVNMLSPLVVRKHIKGEKDQYILYNEEGFSETLAVNISTLLGKMDNLPLVTPIKCKKVIVPAYGANIPASLGIFQITGDVKALQKLYLNGLGSKNSAGFGKFDIVG